jgi:preprotein translocase subunit SecB
MADQPNAAPTGDGGAQAAGAAMQPAFAIDRIYVKDLSLENPGSPQSFQLSEPPSVELGLRMRTEQVAENVWECVLTLTVTATSGDKKIFLIEASQAGLFQIRGVPASEMQPVLMIACPNVLFPYARETIADATMRAGFPPVHLAPINFEALYQQQLAQMQQPVPAVTN